MKHGPWDDWIPGVLSKRQVHTLVDKDFIGGASSDPGDYDYSSVDLRVSGDAYELIGGCVKPFGRGYIGELTREGLARRFTPESDGSFLLWRRHSYLFRIMERIPELQGTPIYGSATAKSSVGRVDVLTRLIVDGMDVYEGFDRPEHISSGDMFLEVTPMTFNVRVKPGTSLTQLRLFKGRPEDCRVQGDTLLHTVFVDGSANIDASLSVDLDPEVTSGERVSAFAATLQSPTDSIAIDLWNLPEADKPLPWKHWKFVFADQYKRLRIEKDRFYIIRSHEKIHLPQGIAVYCRASDETIGEMRIHYAGFVHPFLVTNALMAGAAPPSSSRFVATISM